MILVDMILQDTIGRIMINYKWHACLNSCTRYVFNLGVKPIQTINVFQYARLGQESPTEHNDKASSAYDFLHGKSKSSVEAVEQEHTLL